MKKILLSLLLSATVCLTFTACDSVDVAKLNYQGRNYVEEKKNKFTDKLEENRNSDNKFVDKVDEKTNKDYTWIIYKLWETD